MAARAIEVVQRNPGLASEMQERVFNTAREWGYSDEYIGSLCDKYSAMSPDSIRRRYKENMARIEKEGLRVFGCKRSELPSKLVAKYARKLKDQI